MTDYGVLFRELAVPRLVGTPNHQKVREMLIRELAARGFTVDEHRFRGRSARALFWAPAVLEGTNLIAQRPSDRPAVRPSVWLVAHYDSKGQPMSMAMRLGLLLVMIPAFVVSILVPGVLAAFLFGLLLLFAIQNRVTDNSPGAIDNATAIIAVFMAIDQLDSNARIGVIFTDAEEYGLVGSRALASERADLFGNAAVINLDGLDDAGRPTLFLHRPGVLGFALVDALKARHWRWLPVIVDGIALARVSRECVTILKGDFRTMRIVHTPSDTAEHVRLDGAASIAAALARVLRSA